MFPHCIAAVFLSQFVNYRAASVIEEKRQLTDRHDCLSQYLCQLKVCNPRAFAQHHIQNLRSSTARAFGLSTCMMEFEGVPQDIGEKLWPEFRRVLEKLCATGIDGDRMAVTLDRSSSRDMMSKSAAKVAGKYFTDNYCVVSLGKPSKAFGRAQRETEKARAQRQKQQLGTEGLGRLRKELEDANAANTIPTPEALLKANYHVPDVSVLPSIDIFTVRSGAALPPPTRHRQGHRLLQLLASQNGADKSATGK
eukprot:g46586.t1